MDWKRFYADELAEPGGRDDVLAALTRRRGGDARMTAALRGGAVASFPHVTLRDSADAIAAVVESLLATNPKRVVALGVLHGSVLPAPFAARFASLRDDTPESADAFASLCGAFVDASAVATPFGTIDGARVPTLDPLLRDQPAVLRHEFSLDLFLAFLAAGANAHGVRVPEVIRLYVSAVRSPTGSFDTAQPLADAVRRLLDEGTVCVATGDVAHLGHGYGPDEETARLPSNKGELNAVLTSALQDMHEAALARRDFAWAWAIGTRLRSDQRQMLPVIAHLLGLGAHCEALSFQLSDYAAINGRPTPCFVAAALNLFRPRS